MPYVFYMFSFVFRMFSWTNLLTRCPVPVSVFCCFCMLGPPCFAARIRREPPVPHFQLPRGTKMYDGSTKPEDWLNDYVSVVHIAGGNRRRAMRYIPRMLEGPARIWLNDLKKDNILGWLDFEELFNSNFCSTY